MYVLYGGAAGLGGVELNVHVQYSGVLLLMIRYIRFSLPSGLVPRIARRNQSVDITKAQTAVLHHDCTKVR